MPSASEAVAVLVLASLELVPRQAREERGWVGAGVGPAAPKLCAGAAPRRRDRRGRQSQASSPLMGKDGAACGLARWRGLDGG